MARRSNVPPPVSVPLTPERASKAIERLRKRISELESFDPGSIRERYDPSVAALESQISSTLDWIFGTGTTAYYRYSSATSLDTAGINMMYETPLSEVISGLRKGKDRAIKLLESAILNISEEISEQESVVPEPVARSKSRKVFVVHGRNAGPREAVARFLADLNFEPIILHERPNKGRTIITKFQEEADGVGFAIVLLTPDDVGGLAGDDHYPRARQNVVFELGYFIGKLGADRVASIVLNGVERPSDFEGVLYIDFDERGAWKMDLVRELDAAGYKIDYSILAKR